MSTPLNPEDEIRSLIASHVPEVAAGTVEVVAVARNIGDQALVAVRSRDRSVDPVSVFTGKAASNPLKAIVRELGEKIGVVLWREAPRDYILAAIGPLYRRDLRSAYRTPKVTLDATAR